MIAMRFAEEKSICEIAVALGRTEGAVKQLQFRGLENLREKDQRRKTTKDTKVHKGRSQQCLSVV